MEKHKRRQRWNRKRFCLFGQKLLLIKTEKCSSNFGLSVLRFCVFFLSPIDCTNRAVRVCICARIDRMMRTEKSNIRIKLVVVIVHTPLFGVKNFESPDDFNFNWCGVLLPWRHCINKQAHTQPKHSKSFVYFSLSSVCFDSILLFLSLVALVSIRGIIVCTLAILCICERLRVNAHTQNRWCFWAILLCVRNQDRNEPWKNSRNTSNCLSRANYSNAHTNRWEQISCFVEFTLFSSQADWLRYKCVWNTLSDGERERARQRLVGKSGDLEMDRF